MLACSDTDRMQGGTILPDDVVLRAGDVVFRRGSGFTSQAVLMAEKGGAYSHTGIVVDSAGVLMIVHAVPGEPDFEGDEDRVKMEHPNEFFAPAKAQQGAVYRHRSSEVARQAAKAAVQVYRRGVLFDHDYNSSDTTKMYCTELVIFAYGKTQQPLPGLHPHHLHLVGFESDCFLPSDLQHCKDLKQVTTF
jgi:hypothetical protein